MLKRLILLNALLWLPLIIEAQNLMLEEFNRDRIKTQQTSMLILGGWAVTNIAIGGIAMTQTNGVTKHFHQMNAAWNLVNLSLATVGYLGTLKIDPASLGLYESTKAFYNLQKTFLFNAGLDLGYMAGGAYLIERSRRENVNSDLLKGFGRALILQGAFLFLFDVGATIAQSNHSDLLKTTLGGLSFNGQQVGFHISF